MDYAAPPPGADPGVQDYSNPEWMSAKRGLVTFRKAVIARIILGIGGGLIIGIMSVGAGLGDLDALLWLTFIIAAASVLLTIWAVVGLLGYSKVPAETGARGLATAAMIIWSLGLLLEIYVTYVLARLVFGGFDSLSDLIALGDNSFDLFAKLGNLIGFICLIVSLKKVATHVGAVHVVDMISSFVVMVVIIVVLFVVIAILPVPIIALLGGITLLILLIVALVKFLRILQALGDAIGGLDVSKVFD
jgi:hypothetical protein